ncbi:helicase-related protein [Synechococcus sp. H55.9]|uniref:helicase-related protein n=2 Tax=unclassified Synechococcus TaxID=2626047 RepID=UPI0039C49D1A
MARLEDLNPGARVRGILPNQAVVIVNVKWHGSSAIEVIYKDIQGQPHAELLFRNQEPTLEVVQEGSLCNFEGEGALFRLVSEAHRIRLAHLFDPLLAVHTSLVEPLPHQISAVYEEMLPRQPLRFLLADDPGAGKTIMAGLLIRELLIRGDLHRCLIVCPGSLTLQWQEEMVQKFHLPFEILTNDRLEAARTGNPFQEIPLLIARLDKLSRDEALQYKLKQADWDLVVVDEAHKLSASFFGGEIKETKRYKLGKLLSQLTRHFLLMTATPHNGKEADFQLFLALLDGDRFEGKFRDGAHTCDVSDLMRRLVKEDLVKFDGKPLFPERRAYTVQYALSDLEAKLYQEVTDYVREEFNNVDALDNDGRKRTVGFALTILQRRLASSPEAIYQSLRRRRQRLEQRLREEQLRSRGTRNITVTIPPLDAEGWEEDFEDYTADELEKQEEELVDQATAARTIVQLKAEIQRLQDLEKLAERVRRSGQDRKWEELSKLLQNQGEMFDAGGHRRKLVIFTEHRDTLEYLADRVRTLLGQSEAVVTLHGSMGREERKKAEEVFKQDPAVQILIATDAAGEGINLQRAHLMVNYDLPWNPNRLEQRFGRIHRIGQTEVCHLWNLVAAETREGDVYLALLKKLESEQKALGGKVFDVLGKAIDGKELRELLIEAIRYGDDPEVRARLNQKVADYLDRERLRKLLEERALAHDSMDITKVQQIRLEMQRAEARKLQPHFIASFFLEAFQHLGGTVQKRESKRYEITHVPADIRNRDRQIGLGAPILRKYERITFDKSLVSVPGKPLAEFVCPGHPLLEATIDLILERYRDLLRQGSVLVDERDPTETPRVLVYLEHAIQDGRTDRNGQRRVISRRMQYAEILASPIGRDGPHPPTPSPMGRDDPHPPAPSPMGRDDPHPPTPSPSGRGGDGNEEFRIRSAGYAPYLDYRPLTAEEQALLKAQASSYLPSFSSAKLEGQVTTYAIEHLVPQHFQEVKAQREELINKTERAVKDRLTREINYWDHRAAQLRLEEQAGKLNAKLNSAKARQRADELADRLRKRLAELDQERQLSSSPPVVVGKALVIPVGLLQRLQGKRESTPATFARETQRVEQAAMAAVMAIEQALGYEPRDVSAENLGYDIESRGREGLRFIEVKGRVEGAETVTVTKNEILTALNKPDSYILALVQVPADRDFPEGDVFRVKTPAGTYTVAGEGCEVRYVRRPFKREPDFAASSVNYKWKELWQQGSDPRLQS